MLPVETRLARYLVEARNLWHARRDTDAPTIGNGRAALEIGGTEAELAFCRLANVYPNLETERPGSVDCVVNGRTVDIKWTPRLDGSLVLKPRRRPVDAYVLMRGRYVCAGWYPADLITDRHLTDLGYGPTYIIAAADLLPIQSLIGDARG